MSNFKDWEYLKERWGLEDFEIIEYLNKGLQPYSFGTEFPCPSEYNQLYLTLKTDYENINSRISNIDKMLKVASQIDDLIITDVYGQILDYVEKTIYPIDMGQNLSGQGLEGVPIADSSLFSVFKAVYEIRPLKMDEEILKTVPIYECNRLYELNKYTDYNSHNLNRYIKFRLPEDFNNFKKDDVFKLYLFSDVGMVEKLHKRTRPERIELKSKLDSIDSEIKNMDWKSWSNFKAPQNDELMEKLIHELKVKFFKLADIEKIDREYISKSNKAEKAQKSFPDDAVEFAIEVWPELEAIHEAMETKHGGEGFADGDDSQQKRMENVIDAMDANKDNYKILIKLKDAVIQYKFFKVNNSQSWTITASILQAFIKEKKSGKVNKKDFYQHVKNIYEQNKENNI